MFNTCVISLWVKLTSTGRVHNSLRSCGVATLVSGSTVHATWNLPRCSTARECATWNFSRLSGSTRLYYRWVSKPSFGRVPKNILWTGPNSTISCTRDLPKCCSSFQQKKIGGLSDGNHPWQRTKKERMVDGGMTDRRSEIEGHAKRAIDQLWPKPFPAKFIFCRNSWSSWRNDFYELICFF